MDRYKILVASNSSNLTTSPDYVATISYTVPVASSSSSGGALVSPKAVSGHVKTLITGFIVCNGNPLTFSTNNGTLGLGVRVYRLLPDGTSSSTTISVPTLFLSTTFIYDETIELSAGDKIEFTITGTSTAAEEVDVNIAVLGIEVFDGLGPSEESIT
jgi:hypothetical protein